MADVVNELAEAQARIATLEAELTRAEREKAALRQQPAVGGRHPAWGTHNPILSLGPRMYLELLRPIPKPTSRQRRGRSASTTSPRPGS